MKIFLTGATGFIGSAIVPEFIKAGHQVLGLTRSDAGAKSLVAAGAQVHRGDLEDLESLRKGAAMSDGVIHSAFIHDFSKFQEICETDRRAIEALGAALAGSDRPLIVTSGTAGLAAPGHLATEDDGCRRILPFPRGFGAGGPVAEGRSAWVDAPSAGSRHRQARTRHLRHRGGAPERRVRLCGRRTQPLAGGARLDAARLYRLALEKHETGARYHAVAEEGVPMRDIAEIIGRGLKMPVVSLSPEEAAAHFGWLAMFAGSDLPASSALTQKRLGWRPTGPGLIADLEQMNYSR